MKTLYLCAVGNGEGIRLAITVNRAEKRWERIILLDDDEKKHGTSKLGLPVEGAFSLLSSADRANSEVVNLVTRTTERRAKARAKIGEFQIPFASLVHPQVDLFGTEVGSEVTIYQNASIGAEASVGEGSVVLVGAVVGHGARVGKNCVIAPNAVINARVKVGDGVYVGSNASILPDLTIGEGATIAANTVVFNDVPPRATAIGVPAKIVSIPDAGAVAEAQAQAEAAPLPGAEATAFAEVGAGMDDEARGALEQSIAGILREVLGATEIGLSSNFFDLGCDSLKALQVWERIQGELGKELNLVDVYRFPTVQTLAAFLGGGSGANAPMKQAQERAALRRQMRLGQAKRP